MFWIKLAFPVVLVAGSLLAATRLSRPGMPLGRAVSVIAAPVIAMALLAAAVLMVAAPGERDGLIFGETWASCPFNIATISAPLLVASLWAMKGLAPTRLALNYAPCRTRLQRVSLCLRRQAHFISRWCSVLGLFALMPLLVFRR